MSPASPHTDIDRRHWTLRTAPPWLEPYLRLARLDRPVGTWLLLWPCLWSLVLAGAAWHQAWMGLAMAVGALAMRGAGCVVNDWLDRDLDRRVARTRERPLASGELRGRHAALLIVVLCAIGLAMLLTFNAAAVALGVASLGLVVTYPLAKRVTWWPQAVLGLTFNWGALLGWVAVAGEVAAPALWLYAGCLFWTLGYDTIYAIQDREDDAVIGVRSSARALGRHVVPAVAGFYGLALVLWSVALATAPAMAPTALVALWLLAAPALGLQVWRLSRRPEDPAVALALFRANIIAGAVVLLCVLIGRLPSLAV